MILSPRGTQRGILLSLIKSPCRFLGEPMPYLQQSATPMTAPLSRVLEAVKRHEAYRAECVGLN